MKVTIPETVAAVVLRPAAIVIVEIPEEAEVSVAPDAKLIAVTLVPTELPACSNSIPDTTPSKLLPSP